VLRCFNPLHTRLALNEFQASCYSHHKSQSALSETNWPLRVSGCNITLNPYQTIQIGHHHELPLTRAIELRPDHWSTTLKSHLEISRNYALTTDQSCLINQVIHIIHITSCQPSSTHPHSYPNIETYQPILCISYQYHVSLIPSISFKLHAKSIPNPSFTNHESHHSYITIHLMFLT